MSCEPCSQSLQAADDDMAGLTLLLICSSYRPNRGAKTSRLPVMLLVETSRTLPQHALATSAHRHALMSLLRPAFRDVRGGGGHCCKLH